ncbi:hypothetical protein C7S20_00675 [Christiangramia fulva]|uniref:Uncharacterized protein n=1 Tax=Christiangramia fulva TaxID=2126553 RepID=A0A2R3Z0X5_9FLAO|nr:hypothetical protein C7S20_00675 [Christiangramia fulva]
MFHNLSFLIDESTKVSRSRILKTKGNPVKTVKRNLKSIKFQYFLLRIKKQALLFLIFTENFRKSPAKKIYVFKGVFMHLSIDLSNFNSSGKIYT